MRGRWIWLWAVFSCIGAVLFGAAYLTSFTFRAPVRWAFFRGEYKAQVQSLPEPPNGEFKHIDWDGWGMFSQDTEVYLVFDPTDSLAQIGSRTRPAKVAGVPCEFYRAQRLEKDWYAVVYFTDQHWGDCSA